MIKMLVLLIYAVFDRRDSRGYGTLAACAMTAASMSGAAKAASAVCTRRMQKAAVRCDQTDEEGRERGGHR
jgi:hypothetical protein